MVVRFVKSKAGVGCGLTWALRYGSKAVSEDIFFEESHRDSSVSSPAAALAIQIARMGTGSSTSASSKKGKALLSR